MTEFKAKNNNSSTFYQAFYRSKYSKEAFLSNNGLGPNNVVNFLFAERNLYGRVDQNLNVVVPKAEFLKRISSRENPSGIIGLNFVIDQFQDFFENYQKALINNKIRQNEPFLSKIKVYKSYDSPKVHYEKYFTDLMDNFHNFFLDTKTTLTAGDYFKEFMVYAKQIAPTFPVTYTAWQRSKNSSIFTTGLAFDLSGQDAGDDELKERFINNDNFPYFRLACENFGFSISRNCPWVIVADLGSPVARLYHENYLLSTVEEIFSLQFDQTYFFDLEYIRLNLFKSYNSFVDRFNYEKQVRLCSKNKIIKKNIFRNNINLNKYNNIYNNNYFIKYYNNIRNAEENNIFPESDKIKITENAKNLEKTFDISRAIGYVNEQYRSVYKNKPGGLNDILKRIENKEKTKNEEKIKQQSTGMPSGTPGGSGGSSGY